jgi:gamma-butyrobetaine dioxygenase
MPTGTPAGSVDEVVALFEGWGPHRYDEEVSQLDHALQTAARAGTEGVDDALVAAALLHDVGHLLALRDTGATDRQVDEDLRHEARGAAWLGRLFPPAVTGPVALHVAAKRYRCAVDPAYLSELSVGSTASLARQGGPMGTEERARFERHPAHVDAVRLRGWDDAGKVTGPVDVADLASYRPLLDALART